MNLQKFQEKLKVAEPESFPLSKNDHVNKVISMSVQKGIDEGFGDHGEINQIIVMEELNELSQQISKYLRHKGSHYALLEEIADVLIGIEYLQMLLNITDEEVSKAVSVKINRLEEDLNSSNP